MPGYEDYTDSQWMPYREPVTYPGEQNPAVSNMYKTMRFQNYMDQAPTGRDQMLGEAGDIRQRLEQLLANPVPESDSAPAPGILDNLQKLLGYFQFSQATPPTIPTMGGQLNSPAYLSAMENANSIGMMGGMGRPTAPRALTKQEIIRQRGSVSGPGTGVYDLPMENVKGGSPEAARLGMSPQEIAADLARSKAEPSVWDLGIGQGSQGVGLTDLLRGLGQMATKAADVPYNAMSKGIEGLWNRGMEGSMNRLAEAGRGTIGAPDELSLQHLGSLARDVMQSFIPKNKTPGWYFNEMPENFKPPYERAGAAFNNQWAKSPHPTGPGAADVPLGPQNVQRKSQLGGPWQKDIMQSAIRDLAGGTGLDIESVASLIPGLLAAIGVTQIPGMKSWGGNR